METFRIDRFQERTRVLGPGERSVVWFHGCSRNCPGCVAAEMNRSNDYETIEPIKLAYRVCSVEGVEGLTLSGGEPFDQDVASMINFLDVVRQRINLNIMAYTGYCLAELRCDQERSRILPFIDILIDGPYVESEDHGELWRGSANQQVHFLSERGAAFKELFDGRFGRKLEFEFRHGLQFSFTGVPPKGFKANLQRILSEKDIEINW